MRIAVVFTDGRGSLAECDIPVRHRCSSPGDRRSRDSRDPDVLESEALAMPPARGFKGALSRVAATQGAAVIAEIKRRSPSKGDLAPDLDPAVLAGDYEAGGAACLSVLTDERFFAGSVSDLQEARRACALPVLRKDFTVSRNDVADARLMGADAILLIVAALSEERAGGVRRIGIQSSVSTRSSRCTTRTSSTVALACGADLVGVNQRDLRTFERGHRAGLSFVGRDP